MDSSKGVCIVPLNEKNYSTWRIQMKMYLIKDNLFSIVDGTETEPPADATAAVRESFSKRKSKALANIVLAVETKLLYIIGDPTEPVDVWNKLRDTFQKKCWSNRLRLKKTLYSMKLELGGDLQAHLKTFIELFDELSVIGDPIGDEDRVICLLASLPDSFSTLVTALEAMERVPTWEAVTARLLHEEGKHSSSLSDSKCLSSQVKGKKVIKCFECNKTGHVRKNCYIYLKKNKDKANSAVTENDSELTLAATSCETNIVGNQYWIVDSGATQHMTNDKYWFTNCIELKVPRNVEVGDGRKLLATAIGNIKIQIISEDKYKICSFQNVLYVPELAHNLLSVSQTSKLGNVVQFEDNICKIINGNKLAAVAHKVGKLYILDCVHDVVASCGNIMNISNEELWHRRFCHLGISNVRKLVKNDLVKGINCNISDDKFFCVNCCDGKNHKQPFNDSGQKKLKPFDLVHSDVCGNINPVSLGGGGYFVTFIDDATRYSWVYIIKKKSDVFDTFCNWKSMVEKQYESKIKILRSDNGGEYTSKLFEAYLKKEGIIHQKTVPHTPEQNGVAERLNRTLIESVRSMISDSGLPKTFWAEAVNTANYVKNRSPTSVLNMTPYEALNNHKPNVSHFKIFGSKCYVHIPKLERSKLDSKSKHCIFVGYGTVTKGYRVYDMKEKKVIHCKDVIFNESQFIPLTDSDSSHKYVIDIPSSDNFNVNHDEQFAINNNEQIVNNIEQPINVNEPVRRSTRVRHEPDRYGEWAYVSKDDCNNPITVEEALKSNDAINWEQAIKAELDSIERNQVWTLVEPPVDRKPIKTKWVFKKKLGPDGSVKTFKARLVAQGFSQKLGIDYEETFSPVVRFESVRTVLALSAQNNLDVHHMDVQSAFLNGELSETVYVTQPEGFAIKGKEHLVCKLQKSLYGLKQSPKCWNNQLDNYLKSLNFKQSDIDSCIYTCGNDNNLTIIAVYVDDILIAGHSVESINNIKIDLANRYKMKDLGKLSYFLGVNVSQDNDIFINQASYTKLLLEKFDFINAKPVSTPGDVSNIHEPANENSELFDIVKYQSAIGSLLYLSTKTRPDITFAVCNLAKFCSQPTTKHWSAIKRIFRYLKGTINFGIKYCKADTSKCIGFSDADWAGDKTDRRSTSGYCFKIGSGLVSWRSNKQSCVALSTAEAEYVALSAAAQEAVWIKNLLNELNFHDKSPITLYEDNQSAICLTKNNSNHPKTKHIDIKYHYVRDVIDRNDICVKYCPTSEMLADIFTKNLPCDKFVKLRDMLGIACN